MVPDAAKFNVDTGGTAPKSYKSNNDGYGWAELTYRLYGKYFNREILSAPKTSRVYFNPVPLPEIVGTAAGQEDYVDVKFETQTITVALRKLVMV